MFRYFTYLSALFVISLNLKAQHKVVPLDLFKAHGDLEVTLWAQSPMFYNPTNMDIDKDGRIWIAEELTTVDMEIENQRETAS